MICPLLHGQSRGRGWEWQNPLPQGNAISAIRFAGDQLHGWAIGADGVILYTTDGGFRWETQPTRLVNALNGLYVFDRQHVFAVGARGLILETR
ncbi:MAG TPA: YCF48-related protein, partial [Pyrinomonadaceae bacterium]|nr:YCF48-related protein [Pyrinomonadaceae bacterium]